LNPTSDGGRSLIDLVDQRCIDPDLSAADTRRVLRILLDLLARSGKLDDRDAALVALLEREAQSTTAIGRGVAVPHAEVAGVAAPALALGISRDPLQFDSLDRQPVHLVFLLLFPRGGSGLRMRIVGQVMHLMRKPDARDALRRAASAAEARDILVRFLSPPPEDAGCATGPDG